MYTGNILIQSAQLADLLLTGNFLQITNLEGWCVHQLLMLLKPDNALTWLKLADQLNSYEMKKHCAIFVIKHFIQVIHDELLLSDDKLLKDYMRDHVKSQYSHDDVLRTIIQWADRDATNRLDLLKSISIDEALLDNCSTDNTLAIIRSSQIFYQSHEIAFIIVTNPSLHRQGFLVSVGFNGNSECWKLNEQKIERTCSVK